MKSNGNQKRISDYYIGLDVGTDSVGWAVTDPEYNVLRFRGNAMWGVRLFESANTAAERRQQRTARRLNARKRQRLGLLELLFAEEISKTDPAFFIRMKESSLFGEDKTEISEYPLFNDENYNDRDYFKAYPTAYHLRNELISSDKPHDVRLVYLAIHHILKSRGHFLFDMELSDEYRTVGDLLDDFTERLLDEYGAEAEFKDKAAFVSVITDRNTGITEKKKRIKGLASVKSETEQLDQLDPMKAFDMLTGAAVKLSDLFCDEGLKSAKSLTLDSDINEAADDLTETLGEGRFDLIMQLKQIFDAAKLAQMLGSHQYICEAKVEQFNTNKSDLRRLKVFVKENAPDEYNEIFCQKKDKLNNYAAYSGRTRRSGEYSCKREEFCKYLLKKLPGLEIADGYGDIFRKIKNNDFLPKLKGSENSVIPNQLHLKELRKILDNAEHYLEFLSAKDSEGISVKEKIISVFGFRIPYYVGPLNTESPNSWVVRTDEKIYPWNFENNVDTEKSAEEFIKKLINKCPYTGDDVLPRESLLYSEFCVLNEINPLTVNGKPIPLEQKNEIFDELFLKSHSKVTKKSIGKFLLRKGYIKEGDEISGIDDTVKSKLKSYHDFSRIMDVRENREMVEKIIKAVTIFGDDRKMLKRWLKKNCGDLEKSQVDSICRLSYSDWGNLSETLLNGIYTPDENGEARSVIQMLHETNDNLMQLLSNKYYFGENSEKYRNEKYAPSGSLSDMMDGMYLSPTVKRSLLQSIKIVDEIVDAEKSAPRKIFIEVSRDRENDNAKERTVSRKAKLTELYKSCGKEYIELYNELLSRDESELRKDALYLYYTQLGICLYSGEKIELEKLSTDYDIDHIFPQSRIKDDSLDILRRKLNSAIGSHDVKRTFGMAHKLSADSFGESFLLSFTLVGIFYTFGNRFRKHFRVFADFFESASEARQYLQIITIAEKAARLAVKDNSSDIRFIRKCLTKRSVPFISVAVRFESALIAHLIADFLSMIVKCGLTVRVVLIAQQSNRQTETESSVVVCNHIERCVGVVEIFYLLFGIHIIVFLSTSHTIHSHDFVLGFFPDKFRCRHCFAQKVRLSVIVKRDISVLTEIEHLTHQHGAAVIDSNLRLYGAEATSVIAMAEVIGM